MALTIALQDRDAFWVVPPDGGQHRRFELGEIVSPTRFRIVRDDDESFEISEERGQEILDGVVVSAGYRGTYYTASTVVRAAPEIEVLREPIYRERYG